MSLAIEQHLAQNDIHSALEECMRSNQYFLGLLLGKAVESDTEDYHSTMAQIKRATEKIINSDGKEINEVVKKDKKEHKTDEQLISEIVDEKVEVPTAVVEQVVEQPCWKVKVLCNWETPEQTAKAWNKMSKGDHRWGKVQLVWKDEDEPDYYVIVNAPPNGVKYNKKKSILFRMEPHMERTPRWGEWSNPKEEDFLKVCRHENTYNNVEWHISLTYPELMSEDIVKNPSLDRVVSTVLSEKYRDPGHIKRIDFVKFLEKKGLPVHVYGSNKWEYKDYKGSLPWHCKDKAVLPYKYTFNVENFSIKNYFSEKLVDGIVSECLVFYSGCFNAREYIDERAFVYLELSNFEKDYQIVKKAIEEDWHSQRLPYIRAAKKKILDELQFFPRVERIIEEANQ